MSKIVWDAEGTRLYETGVKNGVLYVKEGNTYGTGVPWNGLTAVTESPSGAEATPLYADDIKYLNLMSAEEFSATVEAYTYPPEFAACNGEAELVTGVSAGQQKRSTFAICYRTAIGNDQDGADHGYKLHIIYNALAAPSEKAYATINDSPEAITFSWELTTTPVAVADIENKKFKPTAYIVIDSTKAGAENMAKLEAKLYGDAQGEPTLLMPDEIVTLLKTA